MSNHAQVWSVISSSTKTLLKSKTDTLLSNGYGFGAVAFRQFLLRCLSCHNQTCHGILDTWYLEWTVGQSLLTAALSLFSIITLCPVFFYWATFFSPATTSLNILFSSSGSSASSSSPNVPVYKYLAKDGMVSKANRLLEALQHFSTFLNSCSC